MKARPVTVGEAESTGGEWDGKWKEQTKAEPEALVKKKAIVVLSERRIEPFRAEEAAIEESVTTRYIVSRLRKVAKPSGIPNSLMLT
jgi:hypothetical protein